MEIQRWAAFSLGETGGNAAGVILTDEPLTADQMQSAAADVGYSETVFATPAVDGWRVRYFAPEKEVPFCGHATIALGAALAKRFGRGNFRLTLNANMVAVEGGVVEQGFTASFQSPPTHTENLTKQLQESVLSLFHLVPTELDDRISPRIGYAGARHLMLCLNSRRALSAMRYDFECGRTLMNEAGWTTIMLVYADSDSVFHARNAFAAGGVYEDPATGAAAAAFAGYLRELAWPHAGRIEIIQGEDMGYPSRIVADIPKMLGASIRVSGKARLLSA